MSEPFLGEIRAFANGYAPSGWARCEGQILPINQNQALYALLGAVYGGNGVTTFALPDLRGRVPIHVSATIPHGSQAGEQSHVLTINEMPQHTHQISASTEPAGSAAPDGQIWAQVIQPYAAASHLTPMNNGAIASAGGSQAHNNMQPYQAVQFCIATQGIFPTRN